MVKRLKDLLFNNRSTKQTVVKNIVWLTVGQIGSRIIRAAIIIYAARLLGVAEYGAFSYALGLAGFFTIFVDIGLNTILTRESSKNPEERTRFFATIFWLKIFLLTLTAGLIITIAPHFSKIEAAKQLITLVAFLTFFDSLRDFVLAFFRSFEKMEWETLINMATNIAITVSGFIILAYAPTAKALLITYCASTAFGALIALLMIKKYLLQIFSAFQKNLIKTIIQSALPVAMMSFLGAFMTNVDLVMLGWLKTSEAVGLYSASQKIIQILYIIPSIFAIAAFPALSRFVQKGQQETIKKLMEKLITVSLTLAVPITIGGIILAKPLISFIYGQDYSGGTIVFQLLLIPIIFIFPGQMIGYFILANDKQMKITAVAGISSILNLGLNYILIPFWSIAGAAIATLISQIFYNLTTWRISKKITDFKTLQHIKKIITGGVLMGIISFLLNKIDLNILINITISGALYFGFLYLVKEKIIFETKELFLKAKGQEKSAITTP